MFSTSACWNPSCVRSIRNNSGRYLRAFDHGVRQLSTHGSPPVRGKARMKRFLDIRDKRVARPLAIVPASCGPKLGMSVLLRESPGGCERYTSEQTGTQCDRVRSSCQLSSRGHSGCIAAGSCECEDFVKIEQGMIADGYATYFVILL